MSSSLKTLSKDSGLFRKNLNIIYSHVKKKVYPLSVLKVYIPGVKNDSLVVTRHYNKGNTNSDEQQYVTYYAVILFV